MKRKLKKNWPWLAGLLIAGLLGATYVLAQFRQGNSFAIASISSFSATERLTAGHWFNYPLVWVGTVPPSEEESQLLLDAVMQWRASGSQTNLAQLEEFLNTLTNSAWAPSLDANLGVYYRQVGRITLSLEHLQAAWEATKNFNGGNEKRVADYALANWATLLASLGRLETLDALIRENGGRVLDRGPMSSLWARTREAAAVMQQHPEIAYKCGTYALESVARKLGVQFDVRALAKTGSPATGFSMKMLADLSGQLGLGLVPVVREVGDQIPVPSVVHWRQNHYAAILSSDGQRYFVADPTFGYPRYMTADTINAEASGAFMAAENSIPAGYRLLASDETELIFGRGYPEVLKDPSDQCNDGAGEGSICCGNGGGGGGSGGSGGGSCSMCVGGGNSHVSHGEGMPVWQVSEPYINLWFVDEPLGYQPALGDRVSFRLSRKQRVDDEPVTSKSSVGQGWRCSWISGFEPSYFPEFEVVWYAAGGGGLYEFPTGQDTATNYYNSLKLHYVTNVNGVRVQYEMLHPNGAKDVYQGLFYPYGGLYYYVLSEKVSAEGHSTTFIYENYDTNLNIVPRLKYVVDADGRTNTLFYPTTGNTNLVVQVTDPFGRSTYLQYDADDQLTNITDVAGLSSSFLYDTNGWPTNLTTPYGTTSFKIIDKGLTYGHGPYQNDRTIEVTEPNGAKQLYGFVMDAPYGSSSYSAPEVPAGTPIGTLDNSDLDKRNSYYWGPKQFSLLSTSDPDSFTANDFLLARMRHWLESADVNHTVTLDTLSVERDFSPDGATEGQKTWYDYPDKGAGLSYRQGSHVSPGVIARVLPDGSTSYTWYRRNDWQQPTNVVSTYTKEDGSIGLRTNVYIYNSNGIDLLEHIGPDGTTQESYTYNGYHQPLSKTDAMSQVTSYTYNVNQQLTSMKTPAGLTTTNIYFSGGDSANFLDKTIDIEIARTNSYTYASNLVLAHTDERGLTTTYSYDGLQRKTSASDSRGTITYTYDKLDLVKVVDRMGFANSYGYDSLRRRVAHTNGLGNYTLYNYCACGALDSVRDALNNYTYYYYDYQGNRTLTVFPDNYAVTNSYNLLGQLINTTDSGGSSVNRWYNNQGLLVTVSNNVGLLASHNYDIDDRAINTVDANGVSVDMTYDDLGRLSTRTYPDSGVEKFGYSARGLIAYTNQLDKVTFYAYDEATRKTFETNANSEIIRFTNNAAGDLLSLTDGKNQTTKWKYDLYGRVTNKIDQAGTVTLKYNYDANDRLTNRWGTAQTTTTTYKYDAVGNLTNVVYKGGVFGSTTTAPEVKMQYDALNRCTNRVDGIGTTKYTYDAAGQLLVEDGPWSSDNITNVYVNRLRTQLSLQQSSGVWTNGFAYDITRRLTNVISSAGAFGYTFRSPGSQLLTAISLPNGSNITNAYDTVVRLTATHLRTSSGTLTNKHEYVYNVANQRTNQTFRDASTHGYTYDSIGQLKKADSSINSEDKSYVYDAAWNLNYRTNNGSTDTFSVDSKNQLTAVNSLTDTYDSSGNLTVHDYASGNNSHIFTYNGENRLTRVDYYFATSLYRTVTLDYDGAGRLQVRKLYDGGGSLLEERRYIYDGWRVIQERDGSNVPTVSYTRGNDLSGSLEGAGGIGGLLGRSHGYSSGNFTNHNFYHADGNGNITFMLNSSQSKVAEYRYNAFGNLLSSSGSLADANKYRFSSKEWVVIDETYAFSIPGLYYYGYRFYAPTLQRWLNRDPIESAGFEVILFLRSYANLHRLSGLFFDDSSLYGFNNNDPGNRFDPTGLTSSNDGNSEDGSDPTPCKDPCPGFKSQWPDIPKWFPKKYACGTAKATCEANCYGLYGEDVQDDAECAVKCAKDCTANFWRCMGKTNKSPTPSPFPQPPPSPPLPVPPKPK